MFLRGSKHVIVLIFCKATMKVNGKRIFYDQAFILRNKKIVKVGLNFTVKDEVNTLEWIIE